jgi:hypothetical protein
MWTLFALQGDPLTFYAYIAFPCYFWDSVIGKLCDLSTAHRSPDSAQANNGMFARLWKGIGMATLVIATTQAMVVRARYIIGFAELKNRHPISGCVYNAIDLVDAFCCHWDYLANYCLAANTAK